MSACPLFDAHYGNVTTETESSPYQLFDAADGTALIVEPVSTVIN
ncbi:hypothetical protein HAPAU_30030 [Halalkalicoccus paucihalophilus]|uniref:Uncharacterized protein n=1 Tax=Halalkalicoccus paucihalophilus TaxID=1008153 RepID=A0A151AB48_9EURY|nr:hypothetical protein HAPAU_30030 [Halalkalicoccus paucihalophilus]